MSLYALIGVQFFGPLEHHCIKNDTEPKYNAEILFVYCVIKVNRIGFCRNLTFNDLAIPDAYCSPDPSGYQCPQGMKCVQLGLPREVRGFNGFDEFGNLMEKSIRIP